MVGHMAEHGLQLHNLYRGPLGREPGAARVGGDRRGEHPSAHVVHKAYGRGEAELVVGKAYLVHVCGDDLRYVRNKVVLHKVDLLIANVHYVAAAHYQQDNQFSFSTAIGLMNNVINFVILVAANKLANKLFGSGLWYMPMK